MSNIVVLSSEVISKIAAGEVIERPAYAVKELVENSLDAQADTIIVEVRASGLTSVRVIDNGIGMDRGDLLSCYLPHTTNKIASLEDLQNIQTQGFRGEALASIAAVSTVTIKSRIHSEKTGWEIVIKGNKIISQKPCGMPVGTEIYVAHIFANHPARRKFLKSERIEFHRILEVLIQFSFAYPNVHFVLTHNAKLILDIPKTTELAQRIEKIMGSDIFINLIPVAFSENHFSLRGFIVKPQITTSTAQKQFFTINNRILFEKNISASVKNAYGTLLAKQEHPLAMLHFTLPSEMVDVNVHPRKEEVRFINKSAVQDFVFRGIKQALEHYSVAYSPLWQYKEKSVTKSFAGLLLKEKIQPWQLSQHKLAKNGEIDQVDLLYLFVPLETGFLLVDQHAAHERILYEQFLAQFSAEQKKKEYNTLLKPFIFDVGVTERELLQSNQESLARLGFEVEHFKGNSFVLTTVPKLFIDRDYKNILLELVEDISQEKHTAIDTLSARMIAFLACRGAVKAGDKLDKKQRQEIVAKLQTTPNSPTCPHGRPTHLVFDTMTLATLFKRK